MFKKEKDNIGKNISKSIAFDFGSQRIRIYKEGNRVLDFPPEFSLEGIDYQNLLKDGCIANFFAVEQLIRQKLKENKVSLSKLLSTPVGLISVPADSADVALRTFRDMGEFIGLRTIYMVSDVFILATALGIDITTGKTVTFVDFGTGKMRVTTIRGKKILKSASFPGSAGLDDAIRGYISRQHQLIVTPEKAESLKIEYADVNGPVLADKIISIDGEDRISKQQKTISVQVSELTECLMPSVYFLIDKIKEHLYNLDYAITSETLQGKIYLVGNGFRLRGLKERISAGLPVASASYTQQDYLSIGLERIQSDPSVLPEDILMQ